MHPEPEAHQHRHDGGLPYAQRIEQDRASKDALFRSSSESPLAHELRHAFTGIRYFAVDEAYRLGGLRLAPYLGDQPVEFSIPTSDGRLRGARRAGTFGFTLDDIACSLIAYDLSGGQAEGLFVPFLDGTSGRETYGAGRYLDVEPELDGTYVLDFNLAYHPLCVYSDHYSCPLTPAENRLSLRVEAGERLPADETAR
jgi:uncharacterized protein (DUF1684 family)